jgi:hypothetical protein
MVRGSQLLARSVVGPAPTDIPWAKGRPPRTRSEAARGRAGTLHRSGSFGAPATDCHFTRGLTAGTFVVVPTKLLDCLHTGGCGAPCRWAGLGDNLWVTSGATPAVSSDS